jgi:hypothetical protein
LANPDPADDSDGNPAQPGTGSIWDSKPWWCQPWTILLTGTAVILASWWLLHQPWITALVAAAIVAWWILFLVLVPQAYRNQP